MDGACAKDGNIRPVAREQGKGGASGKQALFLIPLSTEQDQVNIFPIANLLGDIKRRGDDGQRPLKERGNGQQCASGVQKKRRARRHALRNLFTQPLLNFREQAIPAYSGHRREIQRDGAAMVFLCQSLFFQVGQIATDGVRRNLQSLCQLGNAGLALLSNDIKHIFLSGGFMHGAVSCKMSQ